MTRGNKGRMRSPEDLLDFLNSKKENRNENSLKVLLQNYGDQDKLIEDLQKEKEEELNDFEDLF